MIFARFKAIVAAGLILGAAVVTTPTVSNAAPVSSGWSAAAQTGGAVNTDLIQEARYGRGRGYRHHRAYRRGYGPRRHYGHRRIYPGYGYGYRRPVRCGVVYRQVWTGYGYVMRPRRVCR